MLGKRLVGFVCGSMLAIATASASPATDVTVRYVGTYGSGTMFILFHSPIAEPGCGSSEVRISANHPEKKNWMALALAASQTGATLRVQTEACSGNYPVLGETTNSFLLLWGAT